MIANFFSNLIFPRLSLLGLNCGQSQMVFFRETLSTNDLYEEVVGLNPNFWWLKEDIFYPNA